MLGILPVRNYAISRFRILQQLWQLNRWYNHRIDFRLGSIQDYDYPGMYIVSDPFQYTPCDLMLGNSTGLFNPRRISAVYSEEYAYGDSGFFGCAMSTFAPLGQDRAPFVGMANTRVFRADIVPIDGNSLAITLAHEMGHIFGFRHTLSRIETAQEMHFIECGLDLRYPAFLEGEDSFSAVDATGRRSSYSHDDWNGRLNIMTGGIPPDSLNPVDWGLLDHYEYAAVFDDILRCWFERSQESE